MITIPCDHRRFQGNQKHARRNRTITNNCAFREFRLKLILNRRSGESISRISKSPKAYSVYLKAGTKCAASYGILLLTKGATWLIVWNDGGPRRDHSGRGSRTAPRPDPSGGWVRWLSPSESASLLLHCHSRRRPTPMTTRRRGVRPDPRIQSPMRGVSRPMTVGRPHPVQRGARLPEAAATAFPAGPTTARDAHRLPWDRRLPQPRLRTIHRRQASRHSRLYDPRRRQPGTVEAVGPPQTLRNRSASVPQPLRC